MDKEGNDVSETDGFIAFFRADREMSICIGLKRVFINKMMALRNEDTRQRKCEVSNEYRDGQSFSSFVF